MAQQAADKVTENMFEQDEQHTLINAMHLHAKALLRKAQAETNPQIKALREEDHRAAIKLINKLQGL